MQSVSPVRPRAQRLSTILCEYFGFVLINYCLMTNPQEPVLQGEALQEPFRVDYEWTHLNFTWSSAEAHEEALRARRYIPQNNAIVSFKFYKERIYVALSRSKAGCPATLATVVTQRKDKAAIKKNLLLTPFPSWKLNTLPNDASNCQFSLVSVNGLEVDRRGILWVLDGTRHNAEENLCPPKLLLMDLNKGGAIIQSFTFPESICQKEAGFLNDLVVDEDDGGYAYITDTSVVDPGLIVFSRRQGRAWKLRDKSMFADLETANSVIGSTKKTSLTPIDGIAMSPLPPRRDEDRVVYYSALNSYHIYALSNKVLRNERFCKGDQWRTYIKYAGKRNSLSDGMIVDNKGNLYFGLIGNHGIAKWNIYEAFNVKKIYPLKQEDSNWWPSAFAIDSNGYLFILVSEMPGIVKNKNEVLSNNVIRNGTMPKFKIFKMFIGNTNYMNTNK